MFLLAPCKFLSCAPKFGVRKRSFRLTLKLRFKTWSAEAQLPPNAEAKLQHKTWSAEAQLPPNAEAKLQHSKKLSDERYRC